MNAPRPLEGNQLRAVNPQDVVWLSASAGTGKTHVLASRVMRLLLRPDVDPSQILCLTFTRAGAAEMAVRINEQLARWVRMDQVSLAAELRAIGAGFGPAEQERARTLFASVLDCPGGGLRIDTIHAFSQWLLAAFPEEAGLVPGTRAMEDRDRDLLAQEVLAGLLEDAERTGDQAIPGALADLSIRKGPEAVRQWLMRCASAREVWFGPGAWQPPLRGRVNLLLGLAPDADEADAAQLCSDAQFDTEALRLCLSAYSRWNSATGRAGAAMIAAWLDAEPARRLTMLGELHDILFTRKDTIKNEPSLARHEPDFALAAGRVLDGMHRLRDFRTLLDLAGWLVPALELGRRFALAWDEAKRHRGLIDFDDQIQLAAGLLARSDLRDWIRYKLDRRFDHILIDEAQDTNAAQWDIIFGLAEEFFAGEGQKGEHLRTLFVVGDTKQAIFGFQGTSPRFFESAKLRVKRWMEEASANAAGRQGHHEGRLLQDLGLGRSYRSARELLAFVDRAIGEIGYSSFGLAELPEPHHGDERPGLVVLWPPVGGGTDGDAADETGDETGTGADAPGWFSKPERMMAERIALQVKLWLAEGFPLTKYGRNAGPGDVMVLVRKRKDLAGLIVSRMVAHGVPVAGADRLRLGGPLAVRDVMAALRFAAQPLDDLNLANLLVSPLIGWSQEELLRYGWRDAGEREARISLWEHLRASSEARVGETLERLGQLLRKADYEPPQALIHWILTGPWHGRQHLVARLGREANDPIDELLNAALAYSAAHTPSLQGFIHWFGAGGDELKREQGKAEGQVRVMTVHGAKGLQAPIVILADATGDPDRSPPRELELAEPGSEGGQARKVPLPSLDRTERVGRIAEAEAAAAAAEREEHWRLLYVAMTRAEEALFIGGPLSGRGAGARRGPAPQSWYAKLGPLFPDEPVEDSIWGQRREIGRRAPPIESAARPEPVAPELPEWVLRLAGAEPRPPRPLAPSAAGEDAEPDPPLPPAAPREAALRGTLLHGLLERLPELPPQERRDAALRWLARKAEGLSAATRAEMTELALAVLDTPDWAEIFGPAGLAEVPLAATVGGRVIAGTADRLLVTAERVLVVDFKTTWRPPPSLAEVPHSTLRQMAAYVAALEAIYPGRRVEAAVLYTHAPRLLALPRDVMEEHKRALDGAQ